MVYKKWLVGEKHNSLTYLGPAVHISERATHYGIFLCDCGRKTAIEKSSVRTGNTKHCGAHARPPGNVVHGHTTREYEPPTYVIWKNLKQHAADRGISVCKRWEDSYEHFLEDMGEVPDGHTFTIVDASRPLEPGNAVYTATAANAHWTQGLRSDNSTGVKGLFLHKKNGVPFRWKTQIMAEGVYYRATFPYSEEGKRDAIKWLHETRKEVHGKFANDG